MLRAARAADLTANAKVMTLFSAMLLGDDSIDDWDALRWVRNAGLLGHRVACH